MLQGSVILLDRERLPRRAVLDRLYRRPPRRAGPQHHQQPLHLHAQHRGLLHRLDLLRQRRPRRRRRHRLPADLPRPDAHGLPVVVRAAQDAAHHQGLRHHLDRRLRRLALRQERAAGRPGHDRRGVRHHALHLAPAEGGLDQRRGDPRLPRPGAVLARLGALRGAPPGRVQHPVRHPAHRRHRAPPGHGRGDRLRIDRQAGRLRHRRPVRHLRPLRRLRRPLRPGDRCRLRLPPDLRGLRSVLRRLVRADLPRRDGDPVPAAPVPGRGDREHQRGPPQQGDLAVPALPPGDQPVRPADRARRPAALPRGRRRHRLHGPAAADGRASSTCSPCSPSSAASPRRPPWSSSRRSRSAPCCATT